MKEQFNNALNWAKSLEDVDGCITGSSLIGHFENSNQDIDIFVYNEASMTALLYAMKYNKMFQIVDPLEKWKNDKWMQELKIPYKQSLVTVKYKYNLTIDVNVIIKKDKKTAFDVISSFDLDIVCKAYNIKTKELLDLSQNDGKIAHWNTWNKSFYSEDIWTISSLLRQFVRCIKYHKRGYNTDEVVLKYIELLDRLVAYKNVFNSINFDEKLKDIKVNSIILKKIFNNWLENHLLSEKETELLEQKIKEL